MSNEEREFLENKLEFFKGGLVLIKKELKNMRKDFLKGRITKENIKGYIKRKKDYKFVQDTIKVVEKLIQS